MVTQEPKIWNSHGLKCVAKKSPIGVLVGYVGVTKEHPYYGQHYDDIQGIDVHGGLTYSDKAWWDDDGQWYLGFDCGHIGDIGADVESENLSSTINDSMGMGFMASNFMGSMMTVADEVFQSGRNDPEGPKDMNYVVSQCEKLAEQLARVK